MSSALKPILKGTVEDRIEILEKVVGMINKKTGVPVRLKNQKLTPEQRLTSLENHVYGIAKVMRELRDAQEETANYANRCQEIHEKLFHAQKTLSLVQSYKERLNGRQTDLGWAKKAIEPAIEYFKKHTDKEISPGPDARLVAV